MIHISYGNDNSSEDVIHTRLHEENEKRCEWIREHPMHQVDCCSFYTFDDDSLIGGAVGSVAYNWYTLELLHVQEKYRGMGIASQLIEKICSYDKEKRLTGVKTETWNFQARTFYEKMGFSVYSELKDCPPGTELYFLKKIIRQQFQFKILKLQEGRCRRCTHKKLSFIMHPLCTLCVTFIMHTVHIVSKYNRVIVSIL